MQPSARAQYNLFWSLGLLLLAVLLLWVTVGGYLDDYVEGHGAWMVPGVPAVLTVLAGLVATSLPWPLRIIFLVLMVMGVGLTIACGLLALYATYFGLGR